MAQPGTVWPVATPISWLMIEEGWDVATSDGAVAGHVAEVLGDQGRDIFDGLALKFHRFGHRHYLPAERVRLVVAGRVELDIDSAALESLGRYPRH